MVWIKWLGLVVGTLAVLGAGVIAYGSWRWNEATRVLLAKLETARVPHAVTRYDVREIDGLPAPVQRYFRAALTDGQAMVAAVSINHAGTMNMSATTEQWKPFTSRQRVIASRPGFDWDARIMMFPGVPVRVHDAYIAGAGVLHGAVLGLVTMVKMAGAPEIARGELMRFFAEAVWYPTALLPSQGVRWDAVDDMSAYATLTDGTLTLKMLFRFHADGLIDNVRAEARDRVVDGKTISAPWQGRFRRYEMHAGMRVPQDGEVAWMLPEGETTYYRCSTTSSNYEFAK